MARNAAHRILGLTAMTALTGCAFTDVTIRQPQGSEVATGSRRGEGREIVLVSPFVNRRSQKRCGMKKNGYNTDSASVLCDAAPEVTLAQLVAGQLAAAGFRVLWDPAQAGPSAIVVTGVLDQMFLEPKMNYFNSTFETDIALRLTAQSGSGLLAERTFYVKGEEATALASDEDMRRSFASATRQLVMGVVGAIANLADQFPSGGAAPEPPRAGP